MIAEQVRQRWADKLFQNAISSKRPIDAPNVLEFGDIRWQLESIGSGTRLTLWHNIDRRFISWGAAGWHIAFDLLGRFLSGNPIGRIVGADVMRFVGWAAAKG